MPAVGALLDREREAGLEDPSSHTARSGRAPRPRSATCSSSSSTPGATAARSRAMARPARRTRCSTIVASGPGLRRLHGRSEPVQAGPLHTGHTHPDPPSGPAPRSTRPDYVWIMPWNLRDEIAAQLAYIADWGGRFMVAIPRVEVRRPSTCRGRTWACARMPAASKVVLFCGGQGLRLREYAESVPKPMAPIGLRPVLWHVMRYYAHFGHNDFILCLGYKARGHQGLLPPTTRRRSRTTSSWRDGGESVELLSDRHPGLAHHVRRHGPRGDSSASGSWPSAATSATRTSSSPAMATA